MYILILQSIPIPFLCIFPLFHHQNSNFYTHYISYHLWWGGWHDLSTLICIKNMESFFFKWWIWTFFFRYCHLSTVTTETQNTIPIWKTVRVLMNISTVDRLLCMTWSFILLIKIWIYFIDTIICFFLLTGYSWMWYFGNWSQNFYISLSPCI